MPAVTNAFKRSEPPGPQTGTGSTRPGGVDASLTLAPSASTFTPLTTSTSAFTVTTAPRDAAHCSKHKASSAKCKQSNSNGLRIPVPRRRETRTRLARVSLGHRPSTGSSRSSMGDNRRSYGTRQSTDWESNKSQKRKKIQQVTALVCKHRVWKHFKAKDSLRAVFAIDFFPWETSVDVAQSQSTQCALNDMYSLCDHEDANRGSTLRAGKQDKFVKPWVPDGASARCQLCMAAFHLTRRRHHCRLCGTLVCANCSNFRTFIPEKEPSSCNRKSVDLFDAPSSPSAAKRERRKASRSKQSFFAKKPLRTCGTCCGTLKKMADQDDPRVIHIPLDASQPPTRTSSCTLNSTAASCTSSCSSVLTPSSRKKARLRELRQVLDARTFSSGRSASLQYVINFEWLQQWRLYIDIDQQENTRIPKRCTMVRPGPISNFALLEFRNGRLVPRKSLQKGVDFQVLSQEMWQVLVRLYGGGPSIQIKSQSQGQNCEQLWVIRQEDEPLVKPSSRSTQRNKLPSGSSSSLVPTVGSFRSHTDPSSMPLRRMRTNPPLPPATTINANGKKNVIASGPASTVRMATTTRLDATSAEKQMRLALPPPPHPEMSFPTTNHHAAKPTSHQALYDSHAAHIRTTVANCHFSKTHLFDHRASEDNTDAELYDSDDQTPVTYRETLAAVTAFAAAAMEARKKSAMSLSRHSCVIESRLSSSSTYTFTA